METINLVIDIICISETWINENTHCDSFFPGYQSFHSMRENRRGGGVAIYVRNYFQANVIEDLTCNAEYCWSWQYYGSSKYLL